MIDFKIDVVNVPVWALDYLIMGNKENLTQEQLDTINTFLDQYKDNKNDRVEVREIDDAENEVTFKCSDKLWGKNQECVKCFVNFNYQY